MRAHKDKTLTLPQRDQNLRDARASPLSTRGVSGSAYAVPLAAEPTAPAPAAAFPFQAHISGCSHRTSFVHGQVREPVTTLPCRCSQQGGPRYPTWGTVRSPLPLWWRCAGCRRFAPSTADRSESAAARGVDLHADTKRSEYPRRGIGNVRWRSGV